MIRLSQPNDIAAILSIAEAIRFQPGELEVVHQLLTDNLSNFPAKAVTK